MTAFAWMAGLLGMVGGEEKSKTGGKRSSLPAAS
jgi:hypothetical protein